MTQHETTDGLLDDLLTAAAPFVAAAVTAGADPTWAPMVRLYLSPFGVDVAFHDANDRVRRTWRSAGDPDPSLVEIVARFLNDGVAALPDTQKRATLALLSRGVVALLMGLSIMARQTPVVVESVYRTHGIRTLGYDFEGNRL